MQLSNSFTNWHPASWRWSMSENSRLKPLANDLSALPSQLLATFQTAVVECDPAGSFRFVIEPPKWLQVLLPESSARSGPLDLLDRFPLLESFLPEAEEAWK